MRRDFGIHMMGLVLSTLIPFATALGQSRCGSVFATSAEEQFAEFAAHLPHASKESIKFLFEIHQAFELGFNDPQFFRVLARHPDQVATLNHWWFPGDVLDLNKLSKEIGPALVPLVFDPGIRSRLSAFKSFLGQLSTEERSDPYAVRQAFSRSLGTKIVYRGIRVSKNDADLLSENRVRPRTGYTSSDFSNNSVQALNAFVNKGPIYAMRTRLFGGRMWGNLSQSYASERFVAEAFARTDLRQQSGIGADGLLPVVITAEVPVLDLVSTASVVTMSDRLINAGLFHSIGGRRVWAGRRGLEYFVIGPVPPGHPLSMEVTSEGEGVGTSRLFGWPVSQ